MKTLIIDNYDSFTFNLYQYIAEITGDYPWVIRHDTLTYEEIQVLPIQNIIISPGPGHPEQISDFGVCTRVLQESQLPVLGICLGHQGLCTAYGGQVVLAPEPMHGRISQIKHSNDVLFANIPSSFKVVRYHSWMVDVKTLPTCLLKTAETEDGVIMGLRHRTRPLFGVQYHPESICTQYGKELLKNFLSIKKNTHDKHHLSKTLKPEKIEELRKKFYIDRVLELDNRPSSLVQMANQSAQSQETYVLSVKTYHHHAEPKIFFQHIYAKNNPVVWLDSSLVSPELSRFSILGCLNGPLSYAVSYDTVTNTITKKKGEEEEKLQMSLFDFLQMELQRYAVPAQDYPCQFYCGFVGYFGYEMFQETLSLKALHQSPYPDAQFLFLDRAVVFDHQENKYYLLALHAKHEADLANKWFNEIHDSLQHLNHAPRPKNHTLEGSINSHFEDLGGFNQTKAEYLDHIQECLNNIQKGESYEICLTNQFKVKRKIDPLNYYLHLRDASPAPYAALMCFDDLSIASASIERFLYIDPAGYVETKPIKGTLPRGKTADEDACLKLQLQENEQFKAENLMIVDLLRNDLGVVCEKGSVHVSKLMQVESYQSVHQLVSTICGKLHPNVTTIDCIRTAFPGGSMTGAPKIRTVDIIQHLEAEARGIYSGSMGYLSLNGSVDLNIVIRTAILTNEEVSIGVGGAVTALSKPEQEYAEMLLKAHALRRVLNKV